MATKPQTDEFGGVAVTPASGTDEFGGTPASGNSSFTDAPQNQASHPGAYDQFVDAPPVGARMRQNALSKTSVSTPIPEATYGFIDQAKSDLQNLDPIKAAMSLGGLIRHPINTLFTPQMQADRDEAYRQHQSGNYLGALKGQIEGSIPVLGPLMRPALEALDAQNPQNFNPESVGRSAADLLAMKATPKAYGTLSPLLGRIVGAPAGPVAETAIGIQPTDRAYARTPGRAILDDTSGVKPSVIKQSGLQASRDLGGQLKTIYANAPVGSTAPALQVLDEAMKEARKQNNATAARQIEAIRQALTQDMTTGLPLSSTQTALGLQNLKRGVANQFIHNFNPDTMSRDSYALAKQVYHALDAENDRIAPEGAELNRQISSLVPVTNRAGKADLNMNVLQRMLSRVAKPTGALIPGVTAAYEGGKHYGLPGAIAGGIIGLGVPEVISSPTVQMGVARTLDGIQKATNSPVGKLAARTLGRAALTDTKQQNQK